MTESMTPEQEIATLIARSRASIFALGAISTMMTFYGVWIIAY